MSDSMITKKAIAEGLKELTKSKRFDKISISDITSVCGLNRQTFYYHFQDKYELLNWIYYHEAFINLINGIDFSNWNGHLLTLLKKMKEDDFFYTNTIKCEQNYYEEYLFNVSGALFFDAAEELDQHHRLTEEDKHFYADFFAHGICGVIIQWVLKGMKESPECLALHTQQLVTNCEKIAYEKYIEENRIREI